MPSFRKQSLLFILLLIPVSSALFGSSEAAISGLAGRSCRLGESAVITVHASTNKFEMVYTSRDPLVFQTDMIRKDEAIDFGGSGMSVRVRSIKSDEGIYNPTFYKLLKSRKHPEIRVSLIQLRPLNPSGEVKEPGEIAYALDAELQLAGVTRQVTFDVEPVADSTRGFKMRGSIETRLTFFELEPPVMLFGSIRVSDAIRIEFDFEFVDQ